MTLKQVKVEQARRNAETLRQYVPFPKQEAFHKSNKPIRILRGGNRSGKTTSGAIEVGYWATGQHPYLDIPSRPKILCVANDWQMIANPMWNKLSERGGVKLEGQGSDSPPIIPSRMIADLAWEERAKGIPNIVTLKTGVTLVFRSAQSGRSKFQGTEYDLVWIDEELEDEGVYEELRRSLLDSGGRLIWTATPLARARPLLILHEQACRNDANVEEFVLSMLDNPHTDENAKQAFIAELMREHPDQYATRVQGEFLVMEGLVYSTYKGSTHEISRAQFEQMDPEKRNPRILMIDPGLADPFAMLWGMLLPGERRRIVLYHEYYKKRSTVKDAVRYIVDNMIGDPLILAIIDPSAKKHDASGGLSVSEVMRKEFIERGIKSASTGDILQLRWGDNNIDAGIYKTQEFLAPDVLGGMPGLIVVDDLYNFKREIGRYMYHLERPNKNVARKPMDKDNHLMDCIRYGLMRLPPYQPIISRSKSTYDSFLRWKRYHNQGNEKDSIVFGG